jgi:hypothetical protein
LLQGTQGGSKVKKRAFWIGLAFVAILGTGIPCFAAGTAQTGLTRSKHTMKFQSEDGMPALYGSDIQLLAGKVSTIPVNTFQPNSYTHVHSWQYLNVNSDTHTKHCQTCGSDNDITVFHAETGQETCEIAYGEEIYTGTQYTCECGFQWIIEAFHNYTCQYVDEDTHRLACALDGTDYCSGFDAYSEGHTMDEVVASDDNTHHALKCICGYDREEECNYTAYSEEDEDAGKIVWHCRCGNYIVCDPVEEPEDNMEEPDLDSDHDDYDADDETDVDQGLEEEP